MAATVLAFADFLYFASQDARLAWPYYVAAFLALGVGIFMVVDRLHQRARMRQFGDSVCAGVERSLVQVQHQVFLLQNVFWWYLLPILVGLSLLLLGHYSVHPLPLWMLPTIAISLLIFVYLIYVLNQRVVWKVFLPCKEELESLLMSLRNSDSEQEILEGSSKGRIKP